MCVCVCVCVCVGFVTCGCVDFKCVSVLVVCVLVFNVFCTVSTAFFVLFRLCIFILVCFASTSGILPLSDNSIAVSSSSSNNNNNNNKHVVNFLHVLVLFGQIQWGIKRYLYHRYAKRHLKYRILERFKAF